jgi:hypothetical protein
MARRWYVPLIALPLAIGTAVAVLEGVASASPGLTKAAARTTAVQGVYPGYPMIRPSGAVGLSNGTVNLTQEALNWSGYAVQGGRGAFRSVSASWRQPRVNCSHVRVRTLASFWVGLDGFSLPGQPVDNSVEQTGTAADCLGHRATYQSWIEMFPKPQQTLRNTVRPGDRMSASVTFRGGGTYVIALRDATRHWSRRFVERHAGLARSSAEVITEATALGIGGQIVIQNLSDFGNVFYTRSTINGKPLKKWGRRIQITMTEVTSRRIRATTSAVGAADVFHNHFVRSA